MGFSIPQQYTITSTQDINLFLAGVGSGKTHTAGFLSGYYLKEFPHVFGFIGANTHNQLTTSTLFRVREVWEEMFGWKDGRDYVVGVKPPKRFNTDFHNFDEYHGIISFKWGAVCFKGSLDNAKAHDGKEFGWAILDETKDSREVDVKETILTRLRKPGMFVDCKTGQLTSKMYTHGRNKNRAFNPLYILTSPAKVPWLNEWFKLDEYQDEILSVIFDEKGIFFKEFDDKSVVISSTYHNEHNLPEGYIKKILDSQTQEGGNKLIYGSPFVKSGGEFYSQFKRKLHTGDVPFIPELPIHISFDQNVVPYITATLYQVEYRGRKKIIRQFDEICLENPRNKSDKLCFEFIRRYGSRCSALFFYGDPSGRKSDTRGSEHDYQIIERILRRYLNNGSNRVPYKHPSVSKRRDFINNIFEGVYDDVEVIIDKKCRKSILDFEQVKEDVNGKKKKQKFTDKDKGLTYEKYGHTSDSFDYFICVILDRLFAQHFG